MKIAPKTAFLSLAFALFGACMTGNAAESLRTTVSLNGSWQIAEGTMATPPSTFSRTVPVPGLVDMATPAFEEQRTRYGLALQKPCTASSSAPQYWINYLPNEKGALRQPRASGEWKQFEEMGPAAAVDCLLMTFWKPASVATPQWLAVDLQSPCTIGRVELFWKNAWFWKRKASPAFLLQSSDDGTQWKEFYKTDASEENPRTITFAPVTTRWVRLHLPNPLLNGKAAEPCDFKVFEK